MATATKPKTDAVIGLVPVRRETLIVGIEGTAPLIVHAWSHKAKEMMLAAQQGRKAVKAPKDPEADFLASRYTFADGSGDGFPSLGIKASVVKGGGRVYGKSVKMTELRQLLLFHPDGVSVDDQPLTRIIGGPPTMREDMVRVGMGTADIRYRAMYSDWSMALTVEFLPDLIDAGSVVALIDAGGTNGIGEWRPEKGGAFGTYRVAAE